MRSAVSALVQILGSGLIVAGVAVWSTAAAFVVGGLLVLSIGVALERGTISTSRRSGAG